MCSGPVSPPTNSRLRADERPQLREAELSELDDPIRRRPRVRGRAAAAMRSAASRSDGPELRMMRRVGDAGRQPDDEPRERRLGPAPERIARAHVRDDAAHAPAGCRPQRSRRAMAASAAASGAISTGLAVGSGVAPGQPSIASSRSHWFTTECRGRNSRGRATVPRVHPGAPLDVVPDPLRRAGGPRQPRAARSAVQVDRPDRSAPRRSRRASATSVDGRASARQAAA